MNSRIPQNIEKTHQLFGLEQDLEEDLIGNLENKDPIVPTESEDIEEDNNTTANSRSTSPSIPLISSNLYEEDLILLSRFPGLKDIPVNTTRIRLYDSKKAVNEIQCNEIANERILVITNINNEPTTYKKAIIAKDSKEWLIAMEVEISELESQESWDLVDLPEGKKALGGRWVYLKKPDGRYKARWVIQGFNQILGIDYLDTFSTTCRPESYRLVLILAIKLGWVFLQYDVKNAFVHADIDQIIYTIQPIGFEKDPNKVCLLRKAIYGLKQLLLLWYKYLKTALYKVGFTVYEKD